VCVDIYNSTLSNNIGGLGGNLTVLAGGLNLTNTILVSAGPTLGLNCKSLVPITDGGGNLKWPVSDPTCAGIGSYGDPKLGPLQSNGGPTQTMALQSGSEAIGTAIVTHCPSTDQRGVTRPNPPCDIGAYERSTTKGLLLALQGQLSALSLNLGSPGAADQLSAAVLKPLADSLDPALWQETDGNHLDPQQGSQVFGLHRNAVNELNSQIAGGAYIHSLVIADSTLAAGAVKDAGCDARQDNFCRQANAEFNAGDISAAVGLYAEAIDHYGNSWQQAQQARGIR
jgi:hypothetical protein